MKHLSILGVAALTGMALAANADPISLGDLVDSDRSIAIGDKIFSDFQWLGDEAAGSLTIDATLDGATYLLTIAGSGSDSLFHGTLAYTVSTASGKELIIGIDQTLVPGNNSFATGAESAAAGGSTVGQSSVWAIPVAQIADLEDPEAEAGDVLDFEAQSSIDVTTTIIVGNAGDAPVTDFSLVQSFHQSDGETPGVPDGGLTLLLLGGALSGLALIRRKAAK